MIIAVRVLGVELFSVQLVQHSDMLIPDSTDSIPFGFQLAEEEEE